MTKNVKTFIKLVGEVEEIYRSNMDWGTKFDLIFSPELSVKIRGLGIDFEWCDPDASYEEDVTAYVTAVSQKANELRLLERAQ